MRPIQLGGYLRNQASIGDCPLREIGLGGGPYEVAPKAHKDLRPPIGEGVHGVHRVEPVSRRQRNSEVQLECIDLFRFGTLENPHGSIALHIAMSTYRGKASARPANMATKERHVRYLPNR